MPMASSLSPLAFACYQAGEGWACCAGDAGGIACRVGHDAADLGTLRPGPEQSARSQQDPHAGPHPLGLRAGLRRAGFTKPLGPDADLMGIFEGSAFEPVGLPEPIPPDDPDLVATVHLYILAL